MVYSLEDFSRYHERLRAERERKERDAQFLAANGYLPGQQKQVGQAQDAAEGEWQQLVTELQGRMQAMQESRTSKALESYYSGVMSGADAPFSPETVATMSSRANAPIAGAARANIERLRESFAARGLGRSGGLGSLESRYMQDAAVQGAAATSDIRANAATQNFGARAGGAQGLSSHFGSQQSMLNELATALANMRAQRSFTPSQFTTGTARQTPTTGGFTTDYKYSPPPPLERRNVGASAPTYRIGAGR